MSPEGPVTSAGNSNCFSTGTVRKRFKRTSFELDRLTDGARKVLGVEAGDGVSTVTITSVGVDSGKIEAWQQAALGPGELRQVAAALLEAAQVCEIGG